ncbi:DUF1273 domain-containing protein [Streptococcus sciuri]|uniref:UPF0398 protein NXS10_06520 n=1 Tax=Streptococcus sciuri TaxID=2973939 RepID=A0ABT2F8T2_9STRE|nr:DUF1273 domain-containing protein [Streptococcus sciuri]MCS4488608.1 DUF1273 domain-containing protein [Streptococcus sciuri]
MTAVLISGYKSFELGIFTDTDPRIALIKRAIQRDFIRFLDNGVDWFIFMGNLGFEYWALEVAKGLQEEGYVFSMATLFPFENHGHNWNERNQEKLQAFKNVDFIKFSYPSYNNPDQFAKHNHFVIANTDEAYLFYDEELETNLKYLLASMKNEVDYPITYLTFERLNEIAAED